MIRAGRLRVVAEARAPAGPEYLPAGPNEKPIPAPPYGVFVRGRFRPFSGRFRPSCACGRPTFLVCPGDAQRQE